MYEFGKDTIVRECNTIFVIDDCKHDISVIVRRDNTVFVEVMGIGSEIITYNSFKQILIDGLNKHWEKS